jgi:hypothetical protein
MSLQSILNQQAFDYLPKTNQLIKCSSGQDRDNIIAVALQKISRMHTSLDKASEVAIKRVDDDIFTYFTEIDRRTDYDSTSGIKPWNYRGQIRVAFETFGSFVVAYIESARTLSPITKLGYKIMSRNDFVDFWNDATEDPYNSLELERRAFRMFGFYLTKDEYEEYAY